MPSKPYSLPTTQWWASRRLRYNLALVAVGILAFIGYATIVWSFPERLPDAEITLFTILFQGAAYLLAMAIANVCYFLGPLSERMLKPSNVDTYRKVTYGLGLWFSVLLVFSVPGLALLAVVTGSCRAGGCL